MFSYSKWLPSLTQRPLVFQSIKERSVSDGHLRYFSNCDLRTILAGKNSFFWDFINSGMRKIYLWAVYLYIFLPGQARTFQATSSPTVSSFTSVWLHFILLFLIQKFLYLIQTGDMPHLDLVYTHCQCTFRATLRMNGQIICFDFTNF